MDTLNELQRRQVIVSFYLENKEKGKSFTVQHFQAMQMSKSTIYAILEKHHLCGSTKRQVGSGGHNCKLRPKEDKKILREMCNTIGSSQRKMANHLQVHQTTICRRLKSLGVKCRKRIKAPLYSSEQLGRVKKASRKLSSSFRGKTLILDDECYFSLKWDKAGNSHYYESDGMLVTEKVKFRCEKKFPTRLMMWIAISPLGISEPFFLPSNGAVNAQVYLNECISKRLILFINQLHEKDNVVFWPDLASSHYARIVTTFLTEKGIPFVQRDKNPPNLPQCRPIENFWANLKSVVYEDGWEAATIPQLKRRIKKCLKKMDLSIIQQDISHVPTKLRRVADHGPYVVIS
jgi:transposase